MELSCIILTSPGLHKEMVSISQNLNADENNKILISVWKLLKVVPAARVCEGASGDTTNSMNAWKPGITCKNKEKENNQNRTEQNCR